MSHSISAARSLLFVPGDRPDRFAKAMAAGADAIILDLEDAVRPEAKAEARRLVAAWLKDAGNSRTAILIRTNDAGHPDFAQDLAIAAHPALAGLVLPKATAGALNGLGADTPPVLALIETARGIAEAHRIAADARVCRLLLGSIDLGLDLRLSHGTEGAARMMDAMRATVLVASRVAGLPAPVDGVFAAISDSAGLTAAARLAAEAGMGGMMAIHPGQLATIHDAFQPDVNQRAWAAAVLEAAVGQSGAFTLNGEMIDAPVVARARAILDAASRQGT